MQKATVTSNVTTTLSPALRWWPCLLRLPARHLLPLTPPPLPPPRQNRAAYRRRRRLTKGDTTTDAQQPSVDHERVIATHVETLEGCLARLPGGGVYRNHIDEIKLMITAQAREDVLPKVRRVVSKVRHGT